MADKRRILVTGAGGFAGVNFVRALRASNMKYYIAGTDFNRYHLQLPDLDVRYQTPRHSDSSFVPTVSKVATDEKIDFIHPQPSSEALVLSQHRKKLPAPVFLPAAGVMSLGQDKLRSQSRLARKRIPVAKTKLVRRISDIEAVFKEMDAPLWVRARHGAGGRLSLLCQSSGEARYWIGLWAKKGIDLDEFIIQEYLPGRNIAWDSLWKHGKLVTSYSRERLEYPFKHISPSGITGTPSVARIVHDKRVNSLGIESVQAIDPKPNGAYSVDMKESAEGKPHITEVDAGKFHSTMPLWGYIGVKHLKMPWFANLADLYVRLGLDDAPSLKGLPRTDLFPGGYYLLRDIDVGAYLWREDGFKEKVL